MIEQSFLGLQSADHSSFFIFQVAFIILGIGFTILLRFLIKKLMGMSDK
jgi:hypothetical protein